MNTLIEAVDIEEAGKDVGNATIRLPQGLLGFERIKDYVLLANPAEAPFLWFQVMDDPNLAFLVVSPFEVFPEYQPDIGGDDVEFLELSNSDDAVILNIVTMRPNGSTTMNLKGPIVINRHTRIGKQVVLANAANYSLQHPLPVAE